MGYLNRVWQPVRMGDKELFYLSRGNMNEDGEVANSTDGSPKAYHLRQTLLEVVMFPTC